jgi:hypothetical protein
VTRACLFAAGAPALSDVDGGGGRRDLRAGHHRRAVPGRAVGGSPAAAGGAADISSASDSFFVSAAKDGSLSQYTFEFFIKEASYLKDKDKYESRLLKQADFDFLSFLEPDKERDIKRRRSEYGKRKIPFLSGGGKDVKILQRIFGNLLNRPDGASRIKWFGVGFAVWILKTVLAGAGLLILGGMAAKMLGLNSKKEESPTSEDKETDKEPEEKSKESEPAEKVQEKSKEKPTQALTESDKIWLVPLVGDGSIQDTIRIWILDLYPNLNQYPNIDNVIYSSPKFKKIIDELSSDFTKIGEKYLQMPSRFSSRKQVVNEFIDEIQRKINVP